MIIIGIDPGLSGAVSVIDKTGDIKIFDTPVIEIKKAKGKGKICNIDGMVDILAPYSFEESHLFIEKVHAMKGQGVTSMFNFGKGYGAWLGIVAAFKIPHTEVTPQKWKKEIMDGISDKTAARLRAIQLFPKISDQLSKKKDDGRAESLLIAFWGKQSLFKKQI
jgi:crossover junction endodeoxyribonuclease RuvC